jgi:nitrite reductase/ring-hydroxylating ferredoxin subunit
MGLVSNLLFGRENGIRARIQRKLVGGKDGVAARNDPPPPPPAEAALGLSPEAPKDVTPPEGYEVVLHREALGPGLLTEIIIAGRAITVANVAGSFQACASSCTHSSPCPLGEGSLEDGIITCWVHGWQYNLETGDCLTTPDAPLSTFDVQIVGDAVCVKI